MPSLPGGEHGVLLGGLPRPPRHPQGSSYFSPPQGQPAAGQHSAWPPERVKKAGTLKLPIFREVQPSQEKTDTGFKVVGWADLKELQIGSFIHPVLVSAHHVPGSGPAATAKW